VGTAGYLAPEQATGGRDIDARADVFALGCVLFRCIANRAAFSGDDALTILLKVTLEDAPRARLFEPRTPEPLDDLVARMLAREREMRPADGVEVLAELEEIDDSDCRPSLPNPTDRRAGGSSTTA
jgi:eukaryotic-like serine/threonine-protein kinase